MFLDNPNFWDYIGPVCSDDLESDTYFNIAEQHEYKPEYNFFITVCSDANSSVQQNFIVPKGKVSYPFSIQLPYDLPQSLVATHGRLNYYVRATLERPLYPHQTTRKMFTVKSNVDLSLMPQALVCSMYIYVDPIVLTQELRN